MRQITYFGMRPGFSGYILPGEIRALEYVKGTPNPYVATIDVELKPDGTFPPRSRPAALIHKKDFLSAEHEIIRTIARRGQVFHLVQLLKPTPANTPDGMVESWHIYPVDDVIAHDTESPGDCICGPVASIIAHEDGPRTLYTHHSLDGRELKETDHEA